MNRESINTEAAIESIFKRIILYPYIYDKF